MSARDALGRAVRGLGRAARALGLAVLGLGSVELAVGWAVLAVGSAVLAGAAPARADAVGAALARAGSLVFVKPSDGNVWLAAPDGTQQFEVSADGTAADPYDAPTQSTGAIELFSGRAYMGRADLGTYRPSPRRCTLTAPDGGSGADPRHAQASAFHSLSFSPHGTALAFGFKGAIYVATLGHCRSTMVIARGRDPFWGLQSVAPPRLSLSAARVRTIGGLLRGLRVTVALNTPGAAALSLTEGTHVLARGFVTLAARGRGAVVLRPSPAVAHRVAGLKVVRATLIARVVGFPRPVEALRLTVAKR